MKRPDVAQEPMVYDTSRCSPGSCCQDTSRYSSEPLWCQGAAEASV